MADKFFCKYCGTSWSSVSSLTSGMCPRHPNGPHKGHHAPYEGSIKSKYSCKFCGTTHSSIQSLTSGVCSRHPNGSYKGNHEPMI